MLPQDEALEVLAEFLREHQCEKVNGISIETIVESARIVLKENVFVCGNKFYRQILGGAMGSSFTLTLANIFMWKWEKQAIHAKLPPHEIRGRLVAFSNLISFDFFCFASLRYIDDVLFTWNGSEEKAKELLEEANTCHPNIKLTYQIAKSLPFLDVLISNNDGILSSLVYHKPSAEPTILSFLSDHPRYVFRNVIQTALTRAVRYSSTFEAFNIEQRQIRLQLLYNR